MVLGEYLLKAHTAACREKDGRGGDPWNIYCRMGVIKAWIFLTNRPLDEERTEEEWAVSEERTTFWTFSNDLSGKTIV